jgi:hypothetical protein
MGSDEGEESVDGGAAGADDDGFVLAEGALSEVQQDAQTGAVAEGESVQVQVETAGRVGERFVQVGPEPVTGVEIEFTVDLHAGPASVRRVRGGRQAGQQRLSGAPAGS